MNKQEATKAAAEVRSARPELKVKIANPYWKEDKAHAAGYYIEATHPDTDARRYHKDYSSAYIAGHDVMMKINGEPKATERARQQGMNIAYRRIA